MKAPPLRRSKKRKIKDSVQQRILFKELKNRIKHPRLKAEKYLKYNYPVRTKTIDGKWNIRYVDIAYTLLCLAFEYDGEKWHNKRKDEKRDEELRKMGWKVIHVNKKNIQSILDNLDEIIKIETKRDKHK